MIVHSIMIMVVQPGKDWAIFGKNKEKKGQIITGM